MATDYIKKLNLLLPFVAIGTVADCQSILEPTNRLLVRSGLGIMQAGNFQNSGLSQLLKHTGLQEKISQNYKINSYLQEIKADLIQLVGGRERELLSISSAVRAQLRDSNESLKKWKGIDPDLDAAIADILAVSQVRTRLDLDRVMSRLRMAQPNFC